MPATIVSTANAEHYKWGGPSNTDCDAWYLVKTPDLNIIEELMPPGTSETPHHHVHARQFVFVLEGQLTMMVEHHDFLLHPGDGLEIAPGQLHQAINRGAGKLRFVITSQPPSHDDRVEDSAAVAQSAEPERQSTTSAATADVAVTALVLKIYRQMMSGKLDRTLLTPEASTALTPEILTQAQALFQQFGEPTRLTLKSQIPSAGGTGYIYTGTFTTGDFQVLIDITQAGQVSGYRLVP